MSGKKARHGLGIDIGGSGIKGAPVDLGTGTLAGDRLRIETPRPATPDAVAGVVGKLVQHFGWTHRFGCTFPGVIKKDVVWFAPNMDPSWLGVDVAALLTEATGQQARVLNDADAAALAEARHGAARDQSGVVLVTTLGTGIGTGLLSDGELVPNVELGHVELDGVVAETRAASSAREREDLSWQAWARRLSRYYQHVENLVWPDLIVVGGGVSKKAADWLHLVESRTPLVPATLRNSAGIVGAAIAAEQRRR